MRMHRRLGEDADAAGVWAEAGCIDLLEHGSEPWLAALRSAEPPDAAAAASSPNSARATAQTCSVACQ